MNMGMDRDRLYGPVDGSLLTLHASHRCNDVIKNDGGSNRPLTVRGFESVVWGKPTNSRCLHGRVLEKLNAMSFYGVYSCKSQKIDPHLITALVERWRQETHTFHLPVGEATITLEDVGILWALPVDGLPVSGVIEPKTIVQWQDYCQRLIGYKPVDNAIIGNKLSLRSLADWLEANPIQNESAEEEVEQHARAYAMLLIGAVMFPDSSGNKTSLYYLQLLENIDDVRKYSWGSAVLAFLYRELCTSCRRNKQNIGGALRLLQVWAWMHILPVQPIRTQSRVVMSASIYNGIQLPIPPHAARWNTLMNHTSSSNSNLRAIRESLDKMSMLDFRWTPYNFDELEIASLRPECRPQCCRSVCPLIFFHIIEMHYPDRVVRQFGMTQWIPPTPLYRDVNLHNLDRGNLLGKDWRVIHERWESLWMNRNDTIVDEMVEEDKGYNDGYYDWYRSITRRYISPSAIHTERGFQMGDAAFIDLLAQSIDETAALMRRRDFEAAAEVVYHMERLVDRRQRPRPPPQTQDDGPTTQFPSQRALTLYNEEDSTSYPSQGVFSSDDLYTPLPLMDSSTPLLLPPPATGAPQIPIAWPEDSALTLPFLTNLMHAFDFASRTLQPSQFPSILPINVFDKLVLAASNILHKEPNCVKIEEEDLGSSPSSRSVVVVGDVHGQLHDVLFLLKDAGFPCEDRFFVFNGDYVDRGAWGLEVFLMLLAWKVFMPHRVFLLRGNHESKYCTSLYGFEKEVLTKYGDNGKHACRKCLGCFEALPLASIIARKVYTAHGGLFRGTVFTPSKRIRKKKKTELVHDSNASSLILGSLDELAKARRSVLDPPWEGQNLIPGDVLWSDPSIKPGLAPNKERGIGLLWGPDCTEEFLKKYNLKLIIRSREGPDARDKRPDLGRMDLGYTVDHIVESGRLITLFSAPDYPQFLGAGERYRNKGAYVVLQPPHFDTPVFHSFEAVTPRPKVNPYYDFEEVIGSDLMKN